MKCKSIFDNICYQSYSYLKKNAATILTFVGAAGVIATSIMAVQATPKALEKIKHATDEKGDILTKKEFVLVAGTTYIPTVIMGASTIACIFGANVLNKRSQAVITSAYALVSNSYKEYRDKLIELYGKEADENIRDAIVRQHCNYHQIDIDIPDRKLTFYEENSGEYLVRYEREIMDAEYHLNRNFVMRGYTTLNEFYEFLGLPQTDDGDEIGWSVSDGYYWIDFEHVLMTKKDGTKYYLISTVFPPDKESLEEWI